MPHEINYWGEPVQHGTQIQDALTGGGFTGYTPLTPEQQFRQYGLGQFRPGYNRVREAFYQAQNPLMTQYYLAEPGLSPGDTFGSWMDMMGGAGYSPYGDSNLQERAAQAAFMSRLTGTETSGMEAQTATNLLAGTPWGSYEVDPDVDPFSQDLWDRFSQIGGPRRALYRQTFGTGEDAAQQQANLVQLLALQRAGNGQYGAGSRMGQAITQQLGGIQNYLAATQPETNFLDWYLARTTGIEGDDRTGWLA